MKKDKERKIENAYGNFLLKREIPATKTKDLETLVTIIGLNGKQKEFRFYGKIPNIVTRTPIYYTNEEEKFKDNKFYLYEITQKIERRIGGRDGNWEWEEIAKVERYIVASN